MKIDENGSPGGPVLVESDYRLTLWGAKRFARSVAKNYGKRPRSFSEQIG